MSIKIREIMSKIYYTRNINTKTGVIATSKLMKDYNAVSGWNRKTKTTGIMNEKS